MRYQLTIPGLFLAFILQVPLSGQTALTTDKMVAAPGKNGLIFSHEVFQGPSFGIATLDANGNAGPSTVYSAGLWLSAFDPDANLRFSAAEFFGYNDFQRGPYPYNGNWQWNHWKVSSAQIETHLADLADNGVVDNPLPAIYGWPAKGNPHFTSIHILPINGLATRDLAPFHDADGNGLYNPNKGDYPVVRLPDGTELAPDQFTWYVCNDNAETAFSAGEPLGFEVQMTTFAFNCNMPAWLNRTFFAQQKIINNSGERRDAVQMGIFICGALGCFWDDFPGSVPEMDAVYFYNSSPTDGNPVFCNNELDFTGNIPACSVTFLNRNMDRAMYFYNGTNEGPDCCSSPGNTFEYYNYLNARWPDGHSLVNAGIGYPESNPQATPTAFAYPDSPSDPDGWSLLGIEAPVHHRYLLPSCDIGTLQPGESAQLLTAWAMHRHSALDYLGNVDLMYTELPAIRNVHDNHFGNICGASAVQESAETDAVRVAPNPSGGKFHIEFGEIGPVQQVAVFNAMGCCVYQSGATPESRLDLDLTDQRPGVYQLRVFSGSRAWVRPLVVLH